MGKSMKSVVIMYPLTWFVDTHPKFPDINSLNLDLVEKWFSENLGLKKDEFRKRFRNLYKQKLNIYRNNGFEINWVYFGKEGNLKDPDTEPHSDIFTICPQDNQISAKITYEDLRKRIYPNEKELIRKIGNPSELIVGGFHEDDCVKRIESAHPKGNIDELLTEKFFGEVIDTFNYDLDKKLIDSRHLDAKMHEDNPKEEKERTIKYILAGKY